MYITITHSWYKYKFDHALIILSNILQSKADNLSPCWSKDTNNEHTQSYNVTPNKNLELEYAKNLPVCTLLSGECICICVSSYTYEITSGALQSKSPNPNFLPMLEHYSELIQIELP